MPAHFSYKHNPIGASYATSMQSLHMQPNFGSIYYCIIYACVMIANDWGCYFQNKACQKQGNQS